MRDDSKFRNPRVRVPWRKAIILVTYSGSVLLMVSSANAAGYVVGAVQPPKPQGWGSFQGYTPWGAPFSGGYVGAGSVTSSISIRADLNISAADYESWREASTPGVSPAASAAVSSVPEPTGAMLAIAAGVSLLAYRSRRIRPVCAFDQHASSYRLRGDKEKTR